MNNKILFIVHAALIAALYVVLTLLCNVLGLANHAIQIRFSEALTVLPFFTPAAIPGLTIGCLLSNLLTGCMPLDVLFGSLATFLGALGTFYLRNRSIYLAPLCPILTNTLIVPFILSYVYQFGGSLPYFMITVGIGEIISCGVLGILLLNVLGKYKKHLF